MAWEWYIDAKQLGRFEQRLVKEFPKAGVAANRAAARRSLTLLRYRTRKAPPANPSGVGGPPIDTGRYLRGWYVEKRGDTIVVGNHEEHSVYVENGRRAGARQPPSSALLPWVRRVLGVRGNKAKAVAFLVARAIGRRGLRPRLVANNTLPDILRIHLQELSLALTDAMKKAKP